MAHFFGFVLVKLLPLARNIFIFINLFHFFNHPLPLWAFSGIIKQIIQMEPNMAKDPNRGGKTDGYFATLAEDLNSGLPRTNLASRQSGTSTRGLLFTSPAC